MSVNHIFFGFLLQKKDTKIYLTEIKQELLLEALTQPLSIIYQQFWPTREVPGDWKLPNVISMYKKNQRGSGELQACQSNLSATEGHGADHFACPHTNPCGFLPHSLIQCVGQHTEIRPSQCRFMKSKFCLIKLEDLSN